MCIARLLSAGIRPEPPRWPLYGPCLLVCGLLLLTAALPAAAAGFEAIAVESIFTTAPPARNINPYAIVITSSRRRFNLLPAENIRELQQYFVYQTKVKVQEQIFYRLVVGNYTNANTARIALQRLREFYPDAWIYKRDSAEMKQLARSIQQSAPAAGGASSDLPLAAAAPGAATSTAPAPGTAASTSTASDEATSLLEQARQEFIDGRYDRVIAITDRVTTTGDLDQVRESLELAGITRERQGKFAQAVVLYKALLDTRPPAELETRIQARLDGILTMNQAPKERLQESKNKPETRWDFRGLVQQFYQNDRLEVPGQESSDINQALISDVDLYLQRQTDSDSLVFQLDAGLVNDYLEDTSETRVSEANIEYARDDFSIIGGRQTRTLTGVYNRFDGIVFKDLSHLDYRMSYAYGYVVESSFDSTQSDRPFVAVNLNFTPTVSLDVDLYLLNQEIYGLTDRQAVGTEIRFQNDNSFVYGTIDYDIFYEKFNNLSLYSNYRFGEKWALNLNLAQGYSPILSTVNALQGQSVENIEELNNLFGEDEIYQLAEDRTSKSQYAYLGTSYRFDANRQLYIDLSILNLDATVTSGGVEGAPASEDKDLSVEYSFQGLFFDDDYASIGVRLTDSTNSETTSLRMRTRFSGYGQISYDPRLQLDQRKDKNTGVEQLIFKPSLKLRYRVTKKLNLEGTFSVEYSKTDLPELGENYIYSTYIGYYYIF